MLLVLRYQMKFDDERIGRESSRQRGEGALYNTFRDDSPRRQHEGTRKLVSRRHADYYDSHEGRHRTPMKSVEAASRR